MNDETAVIPANLAETTKVPSAGLALPSFASCVAVASSTACFASAPEPSIAEIPASTIAI